MVSIKGGIGAQLKAHRIKTQRGKARKRARAKEDEISRIQRRIDRGDISETVGRFEIERLEKQRRSLERFGSGVIDEANRLRTQASRIQQQSEISAAEGEFVASLLRRANDLLSTGKSRIKPQEVFRTAKERTLAERQKAPTERLITRGKREREQLLKTQAGSTRILDISGELGGRFAEPRQVGLTIPISRADVALAQVSSPFLPIGRERGRIIDIQRELGEGFLIAPSVTPAITEKEKEVEKALFGITPATFTFQMFEEEVGVTEKVIAPIERQVVARTGITFEKFESVFEEAASLSLIALPEEPRRKIAKFQTGFILEPIKEAREKPLGTFVRVGASLAIGGAIAPITAGLGFVGGAVAGTAGRAVVGRTLTVGGALLGGLFAFDIGTRVATAPTTKKRGGELGKAFFFELAPLGIGGVAGARFATKLTGTLGAIGRTKLPAEEIIAPEFFKGQRFPAIRRGQTAQQLLEEFKPLPELFPGETRPAGFTGTPTPFDPITEAGRGKSFVPGVFQAPRLSPHFLRVSAEQPISLFGLEPTKPLTPTIIRITPEEFKLIPGLKPGETRPSGKESFPRLRRIFEDLQKGESFIPFGKTEKESVLIELTPLKRKRAKFFIEFEGVKAPIDEFAVDITRLGLEAPKGVRGARPRGRARDKGLTLESLSESLKPAESISAITPSSLGLTGLSRSLIASGRRVARGAPSRSLISPIDRPSVRPSVRRRAVIPPSRRLRPRPKEERRSPFDLSKIELGIFQPRSRRAEKRRRTITPINRKKSSGFELGLEGMFVTKPGKRRLPKQPKGLTPSLIAAELGIFGKELQGTIGNIRIRPIPLKFKPKMRKKTRRITNGGFDLF